MKRALILLLLLPTSAWAQTPPVTAPASNAYGSPCPYPETARASHSEGTTFLSYRGTRAGTIEDVKVVQSSGHADLDDAAVACVSHWQFNPDDAARKYNIGAHRTSITWLVSEPGSSKGPVGILAGIPHSCFRYYPEAEQNAGIEGKTVLRFTITEGGDVRDPVVTQSSGNTNLDNAALRCVNGWRYRPAVKDGKPIAVSWQADVVWNLEVPQPPPVAEPHRDCVRSYPIKPEDLAGIDGTTEVTFSIVRGEVEDAKVTHRSGNSALDKAALACVSSRHYVRETLMFNGVPVDKFRSLTIRERITWADALKPAPPSTNAPSH